GRYALSAAAVALCTVETLSSVAANDVSLAICSASATHDAGSGCWASIARASRDAGARGVAHAAVTPSRVPSVATVTSLRSVVMTTDGRRPPCRRDAGGDTDQRPPART